MSHDRHSRKLIIPKGVLEKGNNVVEIPESCEDSRVLIAKLQSQFQRPPGYYPPQANPMNRFERQYGDSHFGFGVPPLSPVREERSSYRSSSPGTPSPYRSGASPSSDRSCSFRDISDLVSPPRMPPSRRPPHRSPQQDSDRSVSSRELSDLVSPPRGGRIPPQRRSPLPCSDRSMSSGNISDRLDPSRASRAGTLAPEELNNSVITDSLAELENVELNELRTVQERMRNFQEARRELVLSILTLQEAEPAPPS